MTCSWRLFPHRLVWLWHTSDCKTTTKWNQTFLTWQIQFFLFLLYPRLATQCINKLLLLAKALFISILDLNISHTVQLSNRVYPFEGINLSSVSLAFFFCFCSQCPCLTNAFWQWYNQHFVWFEICIPGHYITKGSEHISNDIYKNFHQFLLAEYIFYPINQSIKWQTNSTEHSP